MELKFNIGYKELLALIKQLPLNQIKKLKEDLALISVEGEGTNAGRNFQEFLKGGPIMDEDQYQEYITNRQHFTAWRAK